MRLLAFLAMMMTMALAGPNPLEALLQQGPIPAPGKPAFPAHVGVLVMEAQSGQVLFQSRADEAYVPASNLKLFSTSAALYTLGPSFRFETSALASGLADGRVARLTLKGTGDPTLTLGGAANSLEALARALAAKGLREVAELRVDDFAFDWPRWGNGWMWDDSEYPMGALFLDGEGAPYGEMVKEKEALAKGEEPNPTLITDPKVYPLQVGALFKAQLERAGIKVASLIRARAEPTDKPLASVSSRPLAEIVTEANKWSVNIYAEQLYARLGLGSDGTPSTPQRSAAALAEFLKKAGLEPEGWRIRDGSGLSRYNLVTPRQVATLLRYVYLNPLGTPSSPAEAYAERTNPLIRSLPLAGTGEATPEAQNAGGTLRNRLVGSGLEVWAKTGSMTGIASLSGYLRARSGRVLIFSLLMDNYPGPLGDLRNLQDALIKAMAEAY
ncbi:D-alanyl-D-alanine carboxypeptidase/D-alanyl-D-alanine-endopeptidase [Meiothermus granaticius]|uniref:D-alanyl-D-alanine carboxypeptidase DacC n=1 Tax=Meiothermus granaticius NBRC 107808 TaxID=1227551 RepID=A0A399FCW7_9DEIN|nr:D-alanyl-D-alanine carboxypeptidase/D-alanyl-D-alanine-endopeptidase [Meiothermus granaticius]RIH92571.1 D-alanyl-D-alanine carboxypeptidase DacC [Meiothermus granaticius NBRC 107808]GEM88082.1 peptidase S13 [Meiothermus granaticius NBRC 107808]